MADQTNSNVNSVNSNSIALFSAEGNMLRIAYKNEMMLVTIIPKVMEDGRARWPKDLGRTAMLRPQACAALYQRIVSQVLPAIAQGTDLPGYVAVPTNRDNTNLCGVGYANGRVTFNIFMSVDNARRCTDVSSYIFDVTPVIFDYDPGTGKYDMAESNGQFYVFMHALDMCAKVMSGAVGQNCKMTTNFYISQIIAYLRALATKLGVTPEQYGSFSGPRDDGPSFNGGSSGGSSGAASWSMGAQDSGANGPMSVEQLSSLESLMGGAVQASPTITPLQTV